MNSNFNINSFFDELEKGVVCQTDSAFLAEKKKRNRKEFNNSKVNALNRKTKALFTTLKVIDGVTIDPKQWLSLPYSIQSMYNIGKQGKFITIQY
jgi:hypothetical protein